MIQCPKYFPGRNDRELLLHLHLHLHIHVLSPSDIVYHDRSYCAQPPDLPTTHLTPHIESSIALSSFTCDVSTQTSTSHFCIEDIANNAAVNFYSGFSDYRTLIIFLGKAVHHLKYWGSKSTVPSMWYVLFTLTIE